MYQFIYFKFSFHLSLFFYIHLVRLLTWQGIWTVSAFWLKAFQMWVGVDVQFELTMFLKLIVGIFERFICMFVLVVLSKFCCIYMMYVYKTFAAGSQLMSRKPIMSLLVAHTLYSLKHDGTLNNCHTSRRFGKL